MNRLNLTILLALISSIALSQRVGVVLSGGGAKGLAHVGVLKALEENNIPVDYVVGTSMGGIIGGAYAAGMSPDQIEQIVTSEEFLRWVNGFPEEGFNHFLHQNENNPGFLRVNLSLDSILNVQLNTSLASDVSLNFALADLMASASANSKSNFDSLFIPLRVVAADVFTQNQVILKKGSLSDALRATQTVPFFYNPIRVDGKYLFDGGVYNNFPVDVAQAEFGPDVIVGSNVSTKVFNEYPFDTDEKLITRSLLFMLLDKSDPLSVPKNGVYVQPNLEGYTSFDFGKVKALIDSGYAQTMRQMPELLQKVSRRVTCDEVSERRNAFNSKNPPLVYNDIKFKGFNSKQSRYIRRVFHFSAKHPKPFYSSRVKSSYFTMVSQDYFNNIYPNILFDTTTQKFQLQLTRRPQKNFQVDFGGVIATRDVSNIFLGVHLFNFNNQLLHLYGGFQTGNFYKSAVLRARIDFPVQLYLEPELTYDNWDYLETDDLLREITPHTVLRRINRKFGVNFGVPLGNFFKTTVSVHGLNNIDRYANRNVFVSSDTLDELHLSGLRSEINLSSSTLNRKQYASKGRAYSFSGQYFNLRENFIPGSTSFEGQPSKKNHQWFRAKFSAEQYFNAGWFRPGYYAEAVFSNQPFFSNYYGTKINAPGFFPVQDSRTLLLENFRSFNYVAGGLRNVFSIRNRLEFRLEGYLFKPIEYLAEGANQEAETISDLKTVFFASSAGLVLHSPIGPISLSVNYYDDSENQLGVLLHVGYLLFNKHSVE
jgi:NTE family protein